MGAKAKLVDALGVFEGGLAEEGKAVLWEGVKVLAEGVLGGRKEVVGDRLLGYHLGAGFKKLFQFEELGVVNQEVSLSYPCRFFPLFLFFWRFLLIFGFLGI